MGFTLHFIKKDIDFLEEMLETADKALNFSGKYSGKSDLGSANHLMTLIKDWKEELEEILKSQEKVKIKFKDAPIGARFTFSDSKRVWVKINSYPKRDFNDGIGLICSWNENTQEHQSFCCFVDEESGIDFETEIELI